MKEPEFGKKPNHIPARGICNINADTWCKREAAAYCKCTGSNANGKGSAYSTHYGKAHMSHIGPGW